MSRTLLLRPIVALALFAGAAEAADLRVRVEGLRNADGSVLVAVCPEAAFLTGSCPYTGASPAEADGAEVVVRDVPPGVYAVQAFHDENDNLDLDRNGIGFPLEGLGFSRDAPMRFGPPRFADAAFELAEPAARLGLTLRYFRAPGG